MLTPLLCIIAGFLIAFVSCAIVIAAAHESSRNRLPEILGCVVLFIGAVVFFYYGWWGLVRAIME